MPGTPQPHACPGRARDARADGAHQCPGPRLARVCACPSSDVRSGDGAGHQGPWALAGVCACPSSDVGLGDGVVLAARHAVLCARVRA